MPVTTPTLVRNTLSQVVVLSSDPKGTEQIEWQPAGDPNGGDIQAVSDGILGSPAFHRLLTRGIVVVEEAEEDIKAALDKQAAAFRTRLNGAAATAAAHIDPEAKNDMLSVQCVGPDDRGTGQCTQMVPVREKTKDEKPPLCSTHTHLAPQYVADERQEGTEIKKVWLRATLGAREVQQA